MALGCCACSSTSSKHWTSTGAVTSRPSKPDMCIFIPAPRGWSASSIRGRAAMGKMAARLVPTSRADGDDLTLLRFLLGGIGDDDAAGGLFLGIDAPDDDAIVKRAESHAFLHLQDRIEKEPRRRTLRSRKLT